MDTGHNQGARQDKRTDSLLEVFGQLTANAKSGTESEWKKRCCPFQNRRCTRASGLLGYPKGICSVRQGRDSVVLCPERLLDSRRVFHDVGEATFGSTVDLIPVANVKLGEVGVLDYVIAKHRPMYPEIVDFLAVEFKLARVAARTTQPTEALKDLASGQFSPDRSYDFGLGLHDARMRELGQILFKGMVMEQWGTRIYWIVQTPIFKFLKDKYHLASLKPGVKFRNGKH